MIKKQRNHYNTFIICVLSFALYGCGIRGGDIDAYQDQNITINGQHHISVDIAATRDEQSQGLSGRENICSTCGMLFVFDTKDIQHFWMKDMLFDIDVLWVQDYRIVGLIEHVSYLGQEKSKFVSPVPVDHVLELPSGYISEHSIHVGDVIMY